MVWIESLQIDNGVWIESLWIESLQIDNGVWIESLQIDNGVWIEESLQIDNGVWIVENSSCWNGVWIVENSSCCEVLIIVCYFIVKMQKKLAPTRTKKSSQNSWMGFAITQQSPPTGTPGAFCPGRGVCFSGF